MTPEEQARKLVDKFNKTYANNPLLATGGDNRMTAEAVNTGAIARMRGSQQKLAKGDKTIPLRELMKPRR
jgi:hypothetical protein